MTFMHPFYRVTLLALLLTVGVPARAAELGDAIVRSHVGQPLIADIELNALNDPGTAVTVRMAHADVYKGANIGMHPALASLNMSVMKRDGRQFLHITSIAAVNSETVHLFLDLTDGGKRNVRAVTLWLTPDPSPAPPAVVAPVAPPVAAAPALPKALPQPAVAVAKPAPVPAPVPASVLPKPARVLTLPAAAPVCPAPQFSAEQIQACTAVNEQNTILSAQIVDLEAKVKVLQKAMLASPAGAAPAAPVPPRPPKKKEKKEEGFPLLLAASGALSIALLGGGIWYFLKRRKVKSDSNAIPGPAWHARLLSRLKRAPKATTEPATP